MSEIPVYTTESRTLDRKSRGEGPSCCIIFEGFQQCTRLIITLSWITCAIAPHHSDTEIYLCEGWLEILWVAAFYAKSFLRSTFFQYPERAWYNSISLQTYRNIGGGGLIWPPVCSLWQKTFCHFYHHTKQTECDYNMAFFFMRDYVFLNHNSKTLTHSKQKVKDRLFGEATGRIWIHSIHCSKTVSISSHHFQEMCGCIQSSRAHLFFFFAGRDTVDGSSSAEPKSRGEFVKCKHLLSLT